MIRKHYFNLIEITLALLVISIGIMAIMGLIPIGAKAHSNAIHKNQSADAAEQILNIVATACVRDVPAWEATVGTFTPNASGVGGTWDKSGVLVWVKTDTGTPAKGTEVESAPTALTLGTDPSWGTATPQDGVYVFEKAAGKLYRMVRTHQVSRSGSNVTVHEMDAVFAVWADPVKGPVKDSTGTFLPSEVLSSAVRLNVEVSWPGALAYDKREKMYFSMEVQKP